MAFFTFRYFSISLEQLSSSVDGSVIGGSSQDQRRQQQRQQQQQQQQQKKKVKFLQGRNYGAAAWLSFSHVWQARKKHACEYIRACLAYTYILVGCEWKNVYYEIVFPLPTSTCVYSFLIHCMNKTTQTAIAITPEKSKLRFCYFLDRMMKTMTTMIWTACSQTTRPRRSLWQLHLPRQLDQRSAASEWHPATRPVSWTISSEIARAAVTQGPVPGKFQKN